MPYEAEVLPNSYVPIILSPASPTTSCGGCIRMQAQLEVTFFLAAWDVVLKVHASAAGTGLVFCRTNSEPLKIRVKMVSKYQWIEHEVENQLIHALTSTCDVTHLDAKTVVAIKNIVLRVAWVEKMA